MAITNNRLTKEQYEENFTDIHPPFENKTAAHGGSQSLFVLL